MTELNPTFTTTLVRPTRRLWRWALAFVLLLAVGVMTTLILTQQTSNSALYLLLINLNLVLLVVLLMVIGRRFLMLFLDRQRGLTGARLNLRLMAIFGFLALVPTLVVAGFSVVFLNYGIEAWFAKQVTRALDNSLGVARAYFDEHGSRLKLETEAIARDPNLGTAGFLLDPEFLTITLAEAQRTHDLAELALYDATGNILAHTGALAPTGAHKELLAALSDPSQLQQAQNYGLLLTDEDQGRLAAVVPVPGGDLLLVATRWVSPTVLNQVEETQTAYRDYYQLKSERGSIRLGFTMILALLTVCLLAGAVWAAQALAGRIIKPLGALVQATNRVREGALDTYIEPLDKDEIGVLTIAFNRMTADLAEGREQLASKNRELSRRRRDLEAVLTGVTAGVLLVDQRGIIRLANKTARDVLEAKVGQRLGNFNEEMHHIVDQFVAQPTEMLQHQVKLEHAGQSRTLLVRVVPLEATDTTVQSVVLTFDDISALLSAQRVAAWAEVARRIAHEIKNPLTPIQLSAERLKRRYKEQIKEGVETFTELTDVIVRQVEDMRRMVNEFSDFARMPTPVFAPENLAQIVQDVLLLHQTARSNIAFTAEITADNAQVRCDRSQIRQVLNNLVENAVQAIEEQKPETNPPPGAIKIVVKKSQRGKMVVSVLDNGPGLPADVDTERLFDPYVTTRKRGTGLGLAIVRKVVDEHGGAVSLRRRDGRGTLAEIELPLYPA